MKMGLLEHGYGVLPRVEKMIASYAKNSLPSKPCRMACGFIDGYPPHGLVCGP